MHVVRKMTDLTKFRRTGWMFVDWTIFANLSQIRESEISLAELRILTTSRQILRFFRALHARSFQFARIISSTTLAKFHDNHQFWQNSYRTTNFVKFVKIVNKISSNLSFLLLHAFRDISLIYWRTSRELKNVCPS